MPDGFANEAAVPVPSFKSTGTARQRGHIAHRRNFPDTVIAVVGNITFPLLSTATSNGWLNLAAVPGPSAYPVVLPARVLHDSTGRYFPDPVVIAVGHVNISLRIYGRTPGKPNLAAAAGPSANAFSPVQAMVVTVLSSAIFLMRLLVLSVTMILPCASRTRLPEQ